jgi:biopolymer transport protein ExbD
MARRVPLSSSRLISELNMTSIMDLTFLLLLSFMITFPKIEQGIPIRLPKGQAAAVEEQDHLALTLNDQGEIFFNNVPVTPEALAADLKARAEADPEVTILVRADERLAYGKVVTVLRMMHDANITRMALVTEPEK